MGYVPSANRQSRVAAKAIIELIGQEQFSEQDYAIELRIMEHCFPEEYAEEMKKQHDSENFTKP